MAFFHYKAVTPEGKVVEGTLEAADQQTVLARLREQGQLPIKVNSGTEGSLWGREFQFGRGRKRVSRKEVLIFTQELSTLVQAGLTLDRSLTILSELTENAYLKEIVRELLREIKGGKSLSEALAMYPVVFPKVYANMVKAGEIGGALDQILRRIAEYLENVEELRSHLRSAAIYPAFVFGAATLSIIFMMTWVIPRFAVIFENAGAPIPLPMKLLLGSSHLLLGYGWLLILGLLFVGYRIRRYLSTERGRLGWDTRLLQLPLLGSIFQKVEVSRISRTLGTLLKSAVPLLQSISIVQDVVGNQAIASRMEAIRSGVKKGEGLAGPVREAAIFPPFALHLLQVGEETGKMDDMLLQIADAYDRDLRLALGDLVAYLGPAIILTMGVAIALIVGSILHSIMSINDVAF